MMVHGTPTACDRNPRVDPAHPVALRPCRRVVLYTQTGMMLTAFVFAAPGGVAMAFDIPARQAFMVETRIQKLDMIVVLNTLSIGKENSMNQRIGVERSGNYR